MTSPAPDHPVVPEPSTHITVCPDGPLLVRGPIDIVDGAGNLIPRPRSVIALCRCGNTRNTPWCDGTHKLARTSRTGAPVDGPGSAPRDDGSPGRSAEIA